MFDLQSQHKSPQIKDLRRSDLQKNYPQNSNQTKRGCSRNIDTFSIPQNEKGRVSMPSNVQFQKQSCRPSQSNQNLGQFQELNLQAYQKIQRNSIMKFPFNRQKLQHQQQENALQQINDQTKVQNPAIKQDTSSSTKNLSYNTQAQKKQSSTGQEQINFQVDLASDNSDTLNYNDKDMNAAQKLKTPDSIEKNNRQNKAFITSPKPKEQRFFIQTPTLSASRGRLIDFDDSLVSQNKVCSQQEFDNMPKTLCDQHSQRDSDLRESKFPEQQQFNKSDNTTNIKKELEILKQQLTNLQIKLNDLKTQAKD